MIILRKIMLCLAFLFSFHTSFAAPPPAPLQYNPWFFDLGCDSYKVFRDANDVVDVYIFNRATKSFEWFQNLSQYAQKVDYFMEGVDRHYISVTDESGHTVIYKWRAPRTASEVGQFYKWG